MTCIHPELVKLRFFAETKEQCLRKIACSFREAGIITDVEYFYNQMMEREEKLSTGIGHGIAIPHIRSGIISKLTIGIYLLDREIEFNSLDFKKVKLVVCFAIPEGNGNQYMEVLRKVSEFLRSENNRLIVFECRDKETLVNIFRRLINDK